MVSTEYNQDIAKLYASASATSYIRNNKNDREVFMRKQGLEGWSLDESLSNKEHAIWYNSEGKAIFAVRGTDFSNKQGGRVGDLFSDGVLTFGLEHVTPRYKRSERQLHRTESKYGKENVTLTGHSLGGRIVLGLGEKYGLETHAFHAGTSPLFVKQNLMKKHMNAVKSKPHLHNYSVIGDVISNSSVFDGSIQNHLIADNGDNEHVKSSGIIRAHDLGHFY